MSVLQVLLAIGILTLFISVGSIVSRYMPGLSRIHLPGSVLGGVLLLVVGPEGWNLTGRLLPAGEFFPGSYEIIAQFPSIFISIVFACLMLGRKIGSFATVWKRSEPQIVMGHIIAWGQYVMGILVTTFILVPVLSGNALSGVLIAIGFQGGHGTAGGLAEKFRQLGFGDGSTIAYSIATIGIVAGSVLGPLLTTTLKKTKPSIDITDESPGEPERNSLSGKSNESLTGRLTRHLGVVMFVVGIGWLIHRGIAFFEQAVRPGSGTLFSSFIPLFSVVLVAGLIVQLVAQAFSLDSRFNRSVFNSISAFALDIVIASAMGTLALDIVGDYWLTIVLLSIVGLGWNLAVFFILGPRVYPEPWYAYGIGDLGGGTATTASGLLLIRIADPENRTNALLAYSNKQPFYEPFMGGGLVTALALPTLSFVGLWGSLGITGGILVLWIIYAAILAGRNKTRD